MPPKDMFAGYIAYEATRRKQAKKNGEALRKSYSIGNRVK